MMRYLYFLLLISLSCSTTDNEIITDDTIIITDDTIAEEPDDTGETNNLYFPPITGDTWEVTSPSTLNWNLTALQDLTDYVAENNSKAFIILKDGKIVVENYYQDTDATTSHRWNSAAKTLTAYTVGIAQQEGYLSINDASSNYLGTGWTTMTPEQEAAVTIRNQLTMTSGGDYTVDDTNCSDPECLLYLNDAGTEWYYHNAFYTLLQDVVTAAVPDDFNTYYDNKLKSQTGMTGAWVPFGYFRLYFSTARSMARFGLLTLNEGNWDGNQLINPEYFTEMTTPSQDINEAYGYLWWLNGQDSYRLPGTTTTFTGKLIPTAPDDLIAGLGKDDQKVYVLPSEGLVVIRLGDATEELLLGPSGFDTDLWEKIMAVIQ
ncbi:serine hydrolase domain-containing protein [Dokdonia donghaensis]|uniref:serine hydrolase domain-containing protein n=1 Tax=Dokdonia donghaensis TaxID=326320 RepID=UPI0035C78B45